MDKEEWKNQIANEYCGNNMRKLRKMCDKILRARNVPKEHWESFYDRAVDIFLESINSYDESKKCKFNTYFYGNLRRRTGTWFRDNFRFKRCNLKTDSNGKIVRDEKGNSIIIPDISIHTPLNLDDEESTVENCIASDFNVEIEVGISDDESYDKVEKFKNSLPEIQRKFIELKMDGLSHKEIVEKLNINEWKYEDILGRIKINEGFSVFSRDIEYEDSKMEEEVMQETVMEIGVAEEYRMDKYSLSSLLKKKKNGDINCKYILQRKAFQWKTEEVNRYLARILSGLPIPEMVICDKDNENTKNSISYLIDGLQRLSYAEAFKEDKIKISKNGAERHLIQYKEYETDECGNRIFDEDGNPIFEYKIFDIVGKKYTDLPEDLKNRFKEFNINVTRFFHCTDQQIADHIRDYNNHSAMNTEQSGMTKISPFTGAKIKSISENNSFFDHCGKFTKSNSIKGKIDRAVAEAMMLVFFRDNWKSDLAKNYKFVDENATDANFELINSYLNRLECAIGDKNKELENILTVSTISLWLGTFHEFAKYGIEDFKFVDFLMEYNKTLKFKEIDGVSMEGFKVANNGTKKRTTVLNKIDILTKLMKEYLHIEEDEESFVELEEDNVIEDVSTEQDIFDFIKENVKEDVIEDDIEFYKSLLEDWSVEVDNSSKLLEPGNMNSLLAVIAYSVENELDEEVPTWMVSFFDRNTTYNENQKENYTYMVDDLNEFIRTKYQLVS